MKTTILKDSSTYKVPPAESDEERNRRQEVSKFLCQVRDIRSWAEHFSVAFDERDMKSSWLRLVVYLAQHNVDLASAQHEVQEGLRKQLAVQAEPVREGRDLTKPTVRQVVVECSVTREEVEGLREALVSRADQSGIWESLEQSLKGRHAKDIPLLRKAFSQSDPMLVRHMVTFLKLAEIKLNFLLEKQAEAKAAADAATARAERAKATEARHKSGKGRHDRRQAA